MTREEGFEQAKAELIGKDLTITSVKEAHDFHEKFINLGYKLLKREIIDIMPHYRGEQKSRWDITPGIFRLPYSITDPKKAKQLEQKAVEEFEKAIIATAGKEALREIFNNQINGKSWDLLFQAQHAGVRTTLTDWSPEIIPALFFATEESTKRLIEESDGQLWCFIIPKDNILADSPYPKKSYLTRNPFDMKGTYLINPPSYLDEIKTRLFEYRMYRQKGRFVMCSNDSCHIPLNKIPEIEPFLFKIRIPAEYKNVIRGELAALNIIRANMYIEENPKQQYLINEINDRVFK